MSNMQISYVKYANLYEFFIVSAIFRIFVC